MRDYPRWASGAAAPMDVAVAQMLELARLANVSFELVDGRLLMRATRMNPAYWPPVRRCLDELGVDAITDYFRRTSAAERTALSAAA